MNLEARCVLTGVIAAVLYSVMQSYGNSFCGDVVWDSFNKASLDEDNA